MKTEEAFETSFDMKLKIRIIKKYLFLNMKIMIDILYPYKYLKIKNVSHSFDRSQETKD